MTPRRHMGGETYVLTLVALPDDIVPPILRLRRVLKALKRAYGFRADSVRDVTAMLPTPLTQSDGAGAVPKDK